MNDLLMELKKLADKWDSADYAIAEVNNPLLPQEQCAIELQELVCSFESRDKETAMSYDTKCDELARYFLQDRQFDSQEDKEATVKVLAQVIQDAIEDCLDI